MASAAIEEQPRPDPGTVAKLLQRAQVAPVRVIVEFSLKAAQSAPYQPEATLGAAAASAQRQAIQQVQGDVLARLEGAAFSGVKTYQTMPVIALEVRADALRRLADDPAVVRIQEDVAVPPSLRQSVPLIGGDDVWQQGFGGAGPAIAVLDTGVDGLHPFLAGKVVAEACFSTTGFNTLSLCPGSVNGSGPGTGVNCPANVFGCDHGTHVAGIAAGKGPRFIGVAPDADVIAIQVFSQAFDPDCAQSGLPSPCVTSFISDLLLALEHVLSLLSSWDVAAVNMSLGGGAFATHCDGSVLKLAIDSLRAAGVPTVIATGNESLLGMVGQPACISTAVAVGSTTKSDRISGFSNHAFIVDLMAPGSAIRSSVPGGTFGSKSGTSMATPHVAGAFALLKSADPQATVDQMEFALEATGRSVRLIGIAKPRIQVDAALAALLRSPGQPLNDRFGRAAVLAGPQGSTTGSNVNATMQGPEPVHAGVGGGSSVWWRWRALVDGRAVIDTFGSNFDTVLAVYEGDRIRALTEVASNDDATGRQQSRVEFDAVAGITYRIAVDGFQAAQGNIVLNHALTPVGADANDLFADALPLQGRSGNTIGNNQGATAEPGEPIHAGVGGGKSVWWRWRAPASGETVITTFGSSFDTVLAVYRGGSVGQLREIASNDDVPGLETASGVVFDAQAGLTYRIAVDGFQGAEGDITLIHSDLASLSAARVAGHDPAATSAERVWAALAKAALLEPAEAPAKAPAR